MAALFRAGKVAVFAAPGKLSAHPSLPFLRLGGFRASGAALARNTGPLALFTEALPFTARFPCYCLYYQATLARKARLAGLRFYEEARPVAITDEL